MGDSLSFENTPLSLKELLVKFQQAGMEKEERELIYSIAHTRTMKLIESDEVWEQVRGWARRVFVGYPAEYGRATHRLLGGAFAIWLSCSLFFAFVIFTNRNGHWGLWATWVEQDQVSSEEGIADLPKVTSKTAPASPEVFLVRKEADASAIDTGASFLSSLKGSIKGGMFASTTFTFLATKVLSFGILSSVDLGNWVATTLSSHECELKPSGQFVRWVATVQSIVSIYLVFLFLWVTWGTPFG